MRNNCEEIPCNWNASTNAWRAGTLAALAQHKTWTQADYYRIHDKVSQTDLGRRAIKKLVSLKPKEIHKKEQEPASWTKEEEEKLQQLFKEEIATGSVNESEIKEKVSTTNLLEAHSFKAIVLKLRWISAEHRKDIPLPMSRWQVPRRLWTSSPRQDSRVMYLLQSTPPPYNLILHRFGGSLLTSKPVIYSA